MAVRERKAITLDSLSMPQQHEQPVVQAANEITITNLHALHRADYDIIQEYFRRRPNLSVEARLRLSRQIFEGLQQRLGYSVQIEPETFLWGVAAQYQLLDRQQQG